MLTSVHHNLCEDGSLRSNIHGLSQSKNKSRNPSIKATGFITIEFLFLGGHERICAPCPIGSEMDIVHQGRSYCRISRINDTGPSSYRGPNICNYTITNRAFFSKKGPRRSFDTEPNQN
ncbi:hypothetical protein TNCV_2290591 [Trichonephila clavipes]|uniref:Uncharacterized protein n=1 Tax=Trichonephila clavipes TaxID=2585209 RepID=A0A8X6RKD7_TRICX|nr:hypothetical protein TNCV_2290591 [Trichonephila clavipes]